MSKRKFRFGLDYFGSWTIDEIYAAGYSVTWNAQQRTYELNWENK